MGTIQYKPLDSSNAEIRLIELLPKATNMPTERGQTPQCNLIHASLDNKPDYVALSYTWGGPRDTEVITVGDSSVSVTRSLHSAGAPSSDNEEKSWQVQLMKEIYQRATFVSIWLGPADATSDKVIDFLKEIGEKAMKFILDRGPGVYRRASAQWKDLASSDLLSSRNKNTERVTVRNGNDIIARKGFVVKDLYGLYYDINGSHS